MKIPYSLLYILIPIATQALSSDIQTNREIVDSLTYDAISTHQSQMTGNGSDSLLIRVENLDPDEGNYLRVFFGNYFSQKSFRVYRNYNEISSFQGLIVEIDNFKISIKYSKPFEKSFLGMNFVHRQVHYQMNGQIYSGDGQIVEQAIKSSVLIEDEIPYGSITEVDESPYGFTIGKREDYSFWEKIYEPVITIGSVAIIVYLFFSQRS